MTRCGDGDHEESPAPRIAQTVNVASVPHRSPFRYPGGKTWLVPCARRWLRARPRVRLLLEPFAGGGIVGLTAVFEGLAEHVHLVELDADVAAVWETVLSGGAEELAGRIEQFQLDTAGVELALARASDSTPDRAFATIIRNRISRGGIMAPGAGRMKSGENGRGLCSRWYPATIAARIRDIGSLGSRITFTHGDGMAALRDAAGDADVAAFIDPPYTVAGRRLYAHSEVDHEALVDAAAALRGDFLMTYDNAPEVVQMAHARGLQTGTIPMKSTHHSLKRELLVGRDLSWMAGAETRQDERGPLPFTAAAAGASSG